MNAISAIQHSFKEGAYWFHIRRLLLLTGLYVLCRLLFLMFNPDLFSGLPAWQWLLVFAAGLRFDLSAILVLNAPYLVLVLFPLPFVRHRIPRLLSDGYFLFVNAAGLFANCVDMVWYRFVNSRMSAEIFDYLSTGDDLSENIGAYLRDYWFVVLIWLFMVYILWKGMRRWKLRPDMPDRRLFRYILTHLLWYVLLLFVVLTGIRGGWQKRPITIVTAGKYAGAQYTGLIINTPFNIIKTYGKEGVSLVSYFPDEASMPYSPLHLYSLKNTAADFREENVVVIILEGFASEYSQALRPQFFTHPSETYTPFLDSLMRHSLVFKNAYANALRSIDALPAVVSSIPRLMNISFILSTYAANPVHSLPMELKEKGYRSYFFHGGSNGTMGFDAFSSVAGFDQYHGRNEYGNNGHYDGHWGIYDEPFLQYTAARLNNSPEPFFATIFTLSSHHPYLIPEQYNEIFPQGKLPIHQSIRYADFSLRRFFETASQMPWYDNTLFVITSDHTETLEFPVNQSRKGIYEIPLLFFHPQHPWEQEYNSLPAQQIDIMPSILDYLGYDKDFLAFGVSLFDSEADRLAFHYLNNIYQIIDEQFMLEFDGSHPTALYDFINDPHMQKDLLRSHTGKAEELSFQLKARIQEYNNRLYRNQMRLIESNK
jgi:phosphoglycerol transferase MdoB-like AlkP superfamily enzyme